MATADSVKEKIQGLIDSANAVTGQADTELSSAMMTLIEGFGSGGSGDSGNSGGFYHGTYITPERVIQDIEFSTPGGVTNFAFFLLDEPALDTALAFGTSYAASKGGWISAVGSNNNGTAVNASICYVNQETTNGFYYGIKFNENSVTFLASTSTERYVRAPLANKTYVWAAW